jgi:hypothetical protein
MRLDGEWGFFEVEGFDISLMGLLSSWGLTNLRVKNVVRGLVSPPKRSGLVTVEFGGCQCSLVEGIVGNQCADHVELMDRVGQIVSMVNGHKALGGLATKWDFRNLGLVAGAGTVLENGKKITELVLADLELYSTSDIMFS